jgi:hypothetical protein
MRIRKVEEVFTISGRGFAVVMDTTYAQFPDDLPFRIGDPIEFRSREGRSFTSTIVGIEHAAPWTPMRKFAVLIPIDFHQTQFLVGTEVWTDEAWQFP